MSKQDLWQKKFTHEEIVTFLDDVIESYVTEHQHGKEHDEAKACAIVEALEALDYDQYLEFLESQNAAQQSVQADTRHALDGGHISEDECPF